MTKAIQKPQLEMLALNFEPDKGGKIESGDSPYCSKLGILSKVFMIKDYKTSYFKVHLACVIM